MWLYRSIQLSAATNPGFYRLFKTFNEKYGCPVVINTSFNVRGEPIVCTPQEAYLCFMRTNMDYLVLENFVMAKSSQPALEESEDWKKTYELD
jgi:carbamoyltransferase